MLKNKIGTIAFTVTAVIFAFYGICVLAVHSGSPFYMVWFGLAGFMFLLAVTFAAGHFLLILRRILLLLLLIFGLFVAVTWGFIFTALHSAGKSGLQNIIVLGAQVKADGPGKELQYRLDRAYDYLEANPETTCVVSGGRGSNEPAAEAVVMEKYLRERGIAGDRILAETKSENTVQNLVYSKKLINPDKSVGIVTNDFHVFRAVHIAQKNGYQNVCGIAAPSNAFYLPNNMLRESFGILKEIVTGNMTI